MVFNRYQWAALAAALFLPMLLFGATKSSDRKNTALKNLKAFLLMIQYAEGTLGINAYRMLYGGGLFNDYSMHPNIAITKWGITSTAAGAYQFLFSTWLELQSALELPDFSPLSQDKATVGLLRKKYALSDVLSGNIISAIYKCKKIWASFPGAGYGQGEKRIEDLIQFYVKAGGQLKSKLINEP
jgi:muramidase (phage lysozyme)